MMDTEIMKEAYNNNEKNTKSSVDITSKLHYCYVYVREVLLGFCKRNK